MLRQDQIVRRTLMLALGIFLALPMVANAQWGNQNGRWENNGQSRAEQRRRQREYEREQRRRQREASRNDDWRRNEDGRRNDDWRRNDNYDNYGGSSQLRQTALNAGYNEGIKEGRKDRQRGDRFDYRDSSKYQNATTDYNSRFGNQELYRRYYRQGYANGYNDGYQGH
ncbi:MAG: hypothetical protein ABR568_01220 [Pyrinomonadaceae bacterium]